MSKTALSLDPRSKLVMVLVISSLAVWTRDLLILTSLFVLSAAACLLVGSSMAGLLKKGKYFLWLFGAMIIIQSLFSARGEPLLQEEITDMMTVIQLRGVNLKRIPLARRLKTYAYLLMPMIASVLMKSRELSMAMEMRAFRAYPTRTSYRRLTFTTPDYVVMAASGVVLVITAWFIVVS